MGWWIENGEMFRPSSILSRPFRVSGVRWYQSDTRRIVRMETMSRAHFHRTGTKEFQRPEIHFRAARERVVPRMTNVANG
jgi:hypothetical protein